MEDTLIKCTKCSASKPEDRFDFGRSCCKDCRNKRRIKSRENYNRLLKKYKGLVCIECNLPRKLKGKKCSKCLASMGLRYCKKCKKEKVALMEFYYLEATCNDCKSKSK